MISPWCENAGRLISKALATLLGITEPKDAWLTFAVQCRRETANGDPTLSPGVLWRNPLNLTTGRGAFTWPGQIGTYGGGNTVEWHGDFAAFGTVEAGAWACAANYATARYEGVTTAFKMGDPILIAQAIQNSPWDSGHYGYTLIDEVQQELGDDMTDDQLREAIKRIYAGPESLEEAVKADVRVMIEQDPATREAIAAIARSVTKPDIDVSAVVRAIATKLAA